MNRLLVRRPRSYGTVRRLYYNAVEIRHVKLCMCSPVCLGGPRVVRVLLIWSTSVLRRWACMYMSLVLCDTHLAPLMPGLFYRYSILKMYCFSAYC